jgi:hypothetical protein
MVAGTDDTRRHGRDRSAMANEAVSPRAVAPAPRTRRFTRLVRRDRLGGTQGESRLAVLGQMSHRR